MEECGDWRGEGWVLWDSRGERGWGKGGERPKREKDPTQFVSRTTWASAKCLPVCAESVKQVIILGHDTWYCFLLDESHAVLSPKTWGLGEGYKKWCVTAIINCIAGTK